jgi:CRISPR-associated protein Cas2
MSKEGTRYMWLLVFFDLPVKTKRQREIATKFRRFLIQDGYIMIQFSVYARVCNGRERLEKHLKKIQDNLPKKGNVRILEVTDQQYGRMKIIVGNPKENEKKRTDQLLLF